MIQYANIEMARPVFEALRRCEAQLFAAAIPGSSQKPSAFTEEDYLRNQRFVRQMEQYFHFRNRVWMRPRDRKSPRGSRRG
jgi:hypothetical protein